MGSELRKRHYFFSILIVLCVAALCYPFTEWIGYHSVALLLLLTVSILAMRFSLYPVLVAAALSALIWDFFFIPPHFTLTIGRQEDVLLLIMYFVVALLNGIFNYKLRQFEHITRQKEERETSIKLYNTLFDSLSHELRTPISTILGATDVLQENEDKLSKHDKQELTSEITNAALRLNSQLENLLNTSRLESGFIKPNFEWCDVNELIYNTLNKLQTKLDNHKIQIEMADNLPLVKLDFGLMEQVLTNLINNAVNYTPEQSLIAIKAYLIKEEESSDFISENQSVSKDNIKTYTLKIEVSDGGSGIPTEEIEAVFTKFYRLDNTKTGGTGLGLFIAKGFVEAQGGSIKVLNKLDGGASFVIEMPTPVLPQTIHHG
jgi:two-component system, OmpR family, sensor histidine kinase KdpD